MDKIGTQNIFSWPKFNDGLIIYRVGRYGQQGGRHGVRVYVESNVKKNYFRYTPTLYKYTTYISE